MQRGELLRPETDALAERVVGVDVPRSDLRLVGGIVVADAVLIVVGVALLNGRSTRERATGSAVLRVGAPVSRPQARAAHGRLVRSAGCAATDR